MIALALPNDDCASYPRGSASTPRAHFSQARDQMRKEMPMLPLVLSSDSHMFEPPDLWQASIDAAFRDRAPRIQPIDGTD
jgi:hypothetical protein